jgi:Zn-dependent alcohol dehydrogenase
MKFKKGDKVILKLDTKCGNHGIMLDRHNKVCTVTRRFDDTYSIRDGKYLWWVNEVMLEPFIKVGQQLEFEFMHD